jgi:hypothetical protein
MRLWIDTNAARKTRPIRDLYRLARSRGIEVVVHAQVYLEMRRQMRVLAGDGFSATRFDDFLRTVGIRVIAIHLDHPTSAQWADALSLRYPSDAAWERAKQQTLGGILRASFEVEPGQMPMTTDWLIALAVEGDAGSRVITHDDGEEWRLLREAEPKRVLSWEEAVAWLSGLPAREPPTDGAA